jgi:hypothetical protein
VGEEPNQEARFAGLPSLQRRERKNSKTLFEHLNLSMKVQLLNIVPGVILIAPTAL